VPLLIFLIPWMTAKWSYKETTFWLVAGGVIVGLLILYFGVFVQLNNYFTNSQGKTSYVKDLLPVLLAIASMVAFYLIWLK